MWAAHDCLLQEGGHGCWIPYQAKLTLYATHSAWSEGDIEGVLNCYTDDLIYYSNASATGDAPLIIHGRENFRLMLERISGDAESMSIVDFFRFGDDNVGRATVQGFIKHRVTRHTLTGTFRQEVAYRGNRICQMREYHDAARMRTFWHIVSQDEIIDRVLMSAC